MKAVNIKISGYNIKLPQAKVHMLYKIVQPNILQMYETLWMYESLMEQYN